MPNTRPPLDTGQLVDWVVRRAAETSPVRVYPTGALSVAQAGETLAEFGGMRAAGAVAFTDDGHPVMSAALMRRALEYARLFDVPVMAHEEDLQLAARGVANEGPVATRLRPCVAALPRPRRSSCCGIPRFASSPAGASTSATCRPPGVCAQFEPARPAACGSPRRPRRTTSRSPTKR